jgi:SWI/SNF-related matrix-associated actin-dependent regulator 1 of chromatin subfamily A
LAPYSAFARVGEEQERERRFFLDQRWNALLLDEAHVIKNAESSAHGQLGRLVTRGRVLLTGTPFQNDLGELAALLQFLFPRAVGKSSLKQWKAGADAAANTRLVERMKRLLQPFVLRRLKADLAPALPPKTQQRCNVKLAPSQSALYDSLLRYARSEAQRRRHEQRGLGGLGTAAADTRAAAGAAAAGGAAAGAAAAGGAAAGAAAAGAGGGAAAKRRRSNPGPDELEEEEAAVRQRWHQQQRAAAAAAAGAAAAAASARSAPSAAGGSSSSPPGRLPVLISAEARALAESLGPAALFFHLRKVAQHPLLVRSRFPDAVVAEMALRASRHGLLKGEKSHVLKQLMASSDYGLHRLAVRHPAVLGTYALPDDALFDSGKIRFLDELLPRLRAAGSRALIFSQWTTTLDLIGWFLDVRGIRYLRLDGSTAVSERAALVDAFNAPGSPHSVFLLTTRAGGQGLNLTGADTVVLHDLDFNPQIDRQAEDRAYRIGQTRPVTVYRLVAAGTVDADAAAIAEGKLALDAAVLRDVTVPMRPAGAAAAAAAGGGAGAGAGDGDGDRAAAGGASNRRHVAEIMQRMLASEEEEEVA